MKHLKLALLVGTTALTLAIQGFVATTAASPAYYQPTASIAALQAYGAASASVKYAMVNDTQGAGMPFEWVNADESAVCPDGGTWFTANTVANTAGCWHRIYSGGVYLSWFDTLAHADAVCVSLSKTCVLSNSALGTLSGNTTLSAKWQCGSGIFTRSTHTLSMPVPICSTEQQLVDASGTGLVTFTSGSGPIYGAWFGMAPTLADNANSNQQLVNTALASSVEARVGAGSFALSVGATFSAHIDGLKYYGAGEGNTIFNISTDSAMFTPTSGLSGVTRIDIGGFTFAYTGAPTTAKVNRALVYYAIAAGCCLDESSFHNITMVNGDWFTYVLAGNSVWGNRYSDIHIETSAGGMIGGGAGNGGGPSNQFDHIYLLDGSGVTVGPIFNTSGLDALLNSFEMNNLTNGAATFISDVGGARFVCTKCRLEVGSWNIANTAFITLTNGHWLANQFEFKSATVTQPLYIFSIGTGAPFVRTDDFFTSNNSISGSGHIYLAKSGTITNAAPNLISFGSISGVGSSSGTDLLNTAGGPQVADVLSYDSVVNPANTAFEPDNNLTLTGYEGPGVYFATIAGANDNVNLPSTTVSYSLFSGKYYKICKPVTTGTLTVISGATTLSTLAAASAGCTTVQFNHGLVNGPANTWIVE